MVWSSFSNMHFLTHAILTVSGIRIKGKEHRFVVSDSFLTVSLEIWQNYHIHINLY